MKPPIWGMQSRRIGTLNLATAITCTRASSAFYYTAAPNDGSTAFLASASNNVLRIQNRGTRNAVFMEGARTNLVTKSRALNDAAWTTGTGATVTANAGNGPDGTAVAERLQVGGASNFSPYKGDAAQAGPLVATMWARATSGTTPIRFATRSNPANTSAVGEYQEATLTTTYQRLEAKRTSTGYYIVPCDPRDYTPFGGTGVIASSDSRVDMISLEVGRFPSSYIFTDTTTATRSADQLSVVSGTVPAWMRSGKWTVTISPQCSSAEFILAAAEMTLFAFGTGTNNRIALVLDSGAAKIRVVQGGSSLVLTSGFTWSRWQDMVLSFNSFTGAVTLSGASTGNGTTTGTTWTMPSGDLYVGNVSTVATPYFGEMLPTITQMP